MVMSFPCPNNDTDHINYIIKYIYTLKFTHINLDYCIKKLENNDKSKQEVCKNVVSLTNIEHLINDSFDYKFNEKDKLKASLNKDYLDIFFTSKDTNDLNSDNIQKKLEKFNKIYKDKYKSSTKSSLKNLRM